MGEEVDRDIASNDVTGKVVVVNDNETQLVTLGGILRSAGLEAVCFSSAELALAAMSPLTVPSLVVTDVYMPEIDGWQFCRLLRSGDFSYLNQVPILVVSATFAGDETERITSDLGGDAFLSCPVDGAEFVAVVQGLIEGKHAKRKLRVLVVEDDDIFREIVATGLEKDGYEVIATSTLAEAESVYRELPFDIAVVDENLPDGHGSDLVRRVNSSSSCCAFVMMSGNASSGHYLEWMKAGVSASIPKPFKISYLLEVCARARRERSLLRTETLLELRTQELLHRDAEYRVLIAGMPDAFLRFDREGHTLFVSNNAQGLLGIGTENTGKQIRNLPLPSSVQELWEVTVERVFTSGEMEEIEFELPLHDEIRIFNWRLSPEYAALAVKGVSSAARDHICSVVTFARDITQRRRSELNYQVLFREMLSGFAHHEIICDATGKPVDYRFLAVNPAFETLTGLRAENIVGRTVREILPETEPEWIARFGRVALTGKAERFDSYSQEIGKWFSVNAYCPERGHFACIFEDITVQKVGEQEREKLNHALAQAQKMETVGRLAGGIAHDFNNMLSVIMGNVELALSMLDGSEPIQEFLQETLDAAVRSAEITRHLLAFSRRQPIAPREMNLNEQVSSTTKMLGRLIGETVSLEWVPGENLWQICMDPSQVDQLLVNFCVNARDAFAGKPGMIVITTRNCTLDAFFCNGHVGAVPGEYVRLRVRDNGCGMSPEVQEHLFEPFFTTKGQGEGTGLGLATVYGIVKQNKGYVCVDSTVGKGTTFDVYIPRHAKSTEVPAAPAASRRQMPKAQGETILVVEDEETVKQICVSQLSTVGFRVLCAGNPTAALDIARDNAADIRVVISDLMMPGGSGAELIHSLRAICPATGFILMSGYSEGILEREKRTYDLVGVPLLQKPFSGSQLLDKVFEQLKIWPTTSPAVEEREDIRPAVPDLQPDRSVETPTLHQETNVDHENQSRQIAVDLLRVHTMESVGRLAGAMLHETNNQLMVMRWYVEQALQEASPDAPARVWLEKIGEAVTDSVKMNHATWSKHILAFSANQDILPIRLNVNDAVAGVAEQMKCVVAAKATLQVNLSEEPLYCLLDPAQLDQIIVALCINARDSIAASTSGQIEIRTSSAVLPADMEIHAGDSVKPGRYVCLCVKDNGTGIDSDTLEQMFTPFFSTKDRRHAVGLGLTVVDGVTRQNHGCVRVETALHEGTAIHVYVPMLES